MIHALLAGALSADPVERTTAKGARYVTTMLRVPCGQDSTFMGVAAFDETAADRLAVLKKGAGVSVAGELQLNVWTDRDGAQRRDWRVIAVEVLSVHQAARRRRAAREADRDPRDGEDDLGHGRD